MCRCQARQLVCTAAATSHCASNALINRPNRAWPEAASVAQSVQLLPSSNMWQRPDASGNDQQPPFITQVKWEAAGKMSAVEHVDTSLCSGSHPAGWQGLHTCTPTGSGQHCPQHAAAASYLRAAALRLVQSQAPCYKVLYCNPQHIDSAQGSSHHQLHRGWHY